MIFGILLVEWIVLAWMARRIRKTPIVEGQSQKSFYWSIVRGMSWRILLLALFPLPEIAFAIGIFSKQFSGEEAGQMFATAVLTPIMLYPLYLLSVMWRGRTLVNRKFDPREEYLPAS